MAKSGNDDDGPDEPDYEVGYGRPPKATRFKPGQSGNPDSPHYRDLFPIWARDEYVPMLFSEAAVDAAAEARILLRRA